MRASFCPSLFSYSRRPSREVIIGNIGVGGHNPIRVQSMLTSDTMDTAACVAESLALAAAGCEIIRITAQTRAYAANLENIARELRAAGCHVPLVADIHFKPDAAMEAAKWVEKIRINPGNFVDKRRFQSYEYSDEEYLQEVERIREAFSPLVLFCKKHGRAMRLGANHGSLSDRIVNRYGDTPEGMVESALEFARVAHDLGYHQLVFSMKASNVKVMIAAYRLLVKRLNEEQGEGWNYPIHLGVTEAGEGEDARIKSAVGVGSLLADGIGDTLRISLTEDPVYEVAPGFEIAAPYQLGASYPACPAPEPKPSFDPFSYAKRKADVVTIQGQTLGWNEPVRVMLTKASVEALDPSMMKSFMPELSYEDAGVLELDPCDAAACTALEGTPPCLVTVKDGVTLPLVQAFRLLAARIPSTYPILLKDTLGLPQSLSAPMAGGVNMGGLLVDGIGNAVLVRLEPEPEKAAYLGFNILQACGVRLSKTEYISCPSCGRTLYNIQEAAARVRAATSHLKGLKIAIMGCIVNGPGEMSDADFGYVGGAPHKINLYVGHTPVEINIPQEQAVERLVELIKSHGRWVDPE